MELQEFISEKCKMETYLVTAIANITEKFKEKTGFSPCPINVHMVNCTQTGDIEQQYMVSYVTVDVDI